MSKPRKQQNAPAPAPLEMHEYCKMVPRPSPEQYRWLVDDLRKTGRLIEPITLFEGKILDGWSRYKACSEAGIEPRYEQFPGNRREAFDFVLSKNLARRHLTIAQRKALAVQIFKEDPSISTLAAAKKVGLSNKTAEKVRPKTLGKSQRRDTKGRKVGDRSKKPDPAQMTQETQTAIAAHIEECLRNGLQRTVDSLRELSKLNGGPNYTRAQVEHVLNSMRRDDKVIKRNKGWNWKANGQAEPTVEPQVEHERAELEAAGSTAASEPAELPSDRPPEPELVAVEPTVEPTAAAAATGVAAVYRDALNNLRLIFSNQCHDLSADGRVAFRRDVLAMIDDVMPPARVRKSEIAAAKRDLMQKLQPHFDELEQVVALLRGDAERRDAPPDCVAL